MPESMSSPNVYSKQMLDVPRAVDGQPFQLLVRLARELDCVIGGGFIAARGGHTYGTYVLAEPDGSANLHDKDIPTAWEHNYYRGGDDDGVIDSNALGRIGLACGWEWARNRTARRLREGRVELLLGGMCWPSFPTNWPGPFELLNRRDRKIQRQLARELPRQMARLIGAPVSMPSHVGDVDFETPLAPGIPWRTEMVGETQIVERDGRILGRLDLRGRPRPHRRDGRAARAGAARSGRRPLLDPDHAGLDPRGLASAQHPRRDPLPARPRPPPLRLATGTRRRSAGPDRGASPGRAAGRARLSRCRPHPADPQRLTFSRMNDAPGADVQLLAEKLIGYDSSNEDGIRLCAGFVKGWLEARDIRTRQLEIRGLPILVAEVGPEEGPAVILHGHLDVVPGREGQFEPRIDGDRLIGRGAYDMKGAAAAMMLALNDLKDQDEVRVRLAIVPDEEAEDEDYRGTDMLVDCGPGRRLRDHRRADRHARRRRRQGRARRAARGRRAGRPRLDPVGGR